MFTRLASTLAAAALLCGATAANAATIVSVKFDTGELAEPFINAGSNEAALNPVGDGFGLPSEWSSTGSVQVVAVPPGPGSVDGQYRSPWEGTALEDTTGRYTSVQEGGSATLSLASDQDWFFFLWGSGDTYNELTFLNDGVVQHVFTGADLTPPDTASVTAVGSHLVQITDLMFDTVIFESHGANAFEFANIRVGPGEAPPIPIPASLILLFSALAGMGYLGRSRRKLTAA